MARHSEVKFWASKGGYYSTIRGKVYPLRKCEADDKPFGPNYIAAQEEFARLLKEEGPTSIQDKSVDACVKGYVNHVKATAPKSARVTESMLRPFAAAFGTMDAGKLTVDDVELFVDRRASWGRNTKGSAWNRISMCIGYNVRLGRLAKNPFARVKKPGRFRYRPRGAAYAILPAIADAIHSVATGTMRDVLVLLRSTGARPIEILQAQNWHYRPSDRMIVYQADATEGYVHKTADSSGKNDPNRYIHLTPEAEAVVKARAARPGYLFRTKTGRAMDTKKFCEHFARLRTSPAVRNAAAEHGVNLKHIIAYGYRHRYATDCIRKGMPIKLLADLMGTSVTMIEKTYAHVLSDTEGMRQIFLRYQ